MVMFYGMFRFIPPLWSSVFAFFNRTDLWLFWSG